MPTTPRSFNLLLAVATLAMSFAATSVPAQECLNWGDLDKKLYCDESRDLVADTPSKGYQLKDPDTLVFSYAPVEDPSIYQAAFAGFMDYLSQITGRKVQWHGSKSAADQIKAIRAGEVHIAGISPGPTVYAVNLAGYVPIAVMCKADRTFGSKLDLITKKNSNIASTGDLNGRKVARASSLSDSGVPGAGIEFVDSGSQGKSISGVIDGSYDAAAVNSNVLARMQDRGAVDGAQLRSVWESKSLPPTSFGFAHNLTPDLQRKVHEAFLTYDWDGAGLAKEFGRQADMFCTISYEETWESIRLMQKENGVVYKTSDL